MRRHRFLYALIVTATTAFGPMALAAETAQSFVDKATVGGLFEVESSKLALSHAQDAELKEFAQMMVRDHTKANESLETIAKQQKLTVPTKLDAPHEAKIEALKKAGDQIDKPYAKDQLEGHKTTIALFQGYATSGDNAALKTFAQETLPTLEAHLSKIEGITASMGVAN
ncbi:hypothetical protein CKO38_00855 [Rhodospirillum rubrum]|uniref:DUF4142 domain-containing protein n=1 Tax=Rhodospirillum rubrum TaxID=1085 RepID=UPI0019075CCC|nr:DUF4142 domain-containing protein [Rhodospirillum rubrum]MBK1662957.1 hypothetical protein [Rhodospirillum rubrum]MBK1675244.1 hypothetical protein [Rhodospirillum rubrum]